jgi:hypothetical protein
MLAPSFLWAWLSDPAGAGLVDVSIDTDESQIRRRWRRGIAMQSP